MKTPEELAEEFAEKVHSSLVQITAVFSENERIFNYENMKDTFLAGYEAAKEKYEARIKELEQAIIKSVDAMAGVQYDDENT